MDKIENLKARMIFDSRGLPTVEVVLKTSKGTYVSSCPSGASTGSSEACELRDGGSNFHGKGVYNAIKNVNEIISPALLSKSVTDQSAIDKLMISLDGTTNKSKLGANAILPVSMAICRAAADLKGIPLYAHISESNIKSSGKTLPYPCFNIINGGQHAGNRIPVQEFMICPVGASNFAEAMQMASETYQTLKSLLKSKLGISSLNVGDEGGFAPMFSLASSLDEVYAALDILVEAIEKSGYTGRIKIGIDAAASEFYSEKKNKYMIDYKGENKDEKTSEEMVSFYESLISKYPFAFIEDPLNEEDWDGFAKATEKLKLLIIGDDLLTTNPKRIKKAVQNKSCNALLLKLNQIGTVTEAIEAVRIAQENGWKVMTSHRSGETNDDFIADLAVGLGTEYIKTGATCRGERLAKYNRLMRIEEELKEEANMSKIQ